MSNSPTDYQNLVIYKINCLDENIKDCYVGSTTNLSKRTYNHKWHCNNPNSYKYHRHIYNFIRKNGGWINWTVSIIEKYPCITKQEAYKRETFWMKSLNSTLNTINAYTNQNNYNRNYYKNNIDKIRNYRERNKDKIKLWKCQKHFCQCGIHDTNGHKSRHLKSFKHQSRMELFDKINDIIKNFQNHYYHLHQI